LAAGDAGIASSCSTWRQKLQTLRDHGAAMPVWPFRGWIAAGLVIKGMNRL
jgi:hypothetical protein